MSDVLTVREIKSWFDTWDYFQDLALGEPRLHGNGFLQLDLRDGYRLNIWSPDLPSTQRVSTPIHDHRWSFTSRVLLGVQTHSEYAFDEEPEGTHEVYEVCRNAVSEDTLLRGMGIYGTPRRLNDLRIPAGDSYCFFKGLFHATPTPGYAMTLMCKYGVNPMHSTRVLCGRDLYPDNVFNRYQEDFELLWSIVRTSVLKFLLG